MKKPALSVSLMCMDLLQVGRQLSVLDPAADWYHIDLMDWHYVRNLTLSPDFMKAVRRASSVPMDAHLMVDAVDLDLVRLCVESGAKCVSLHPETAEPRIYRILQYLKQQKVQFGVVLNPATPLQTAQAYLEHVDKVTYMAVDPGFAGQAFIPDVLRKIEEGCRLRAGRGLHFRIEVDGGCNRSTFRPILQAGCDQIIVGGSALFSRDADLQKADAQLQHELAEAAQ